MAADKYLDRTEASAYLWARGVRYTRGTLTTYAAKGKGPPYRIVGAGLGKAIYNVRELDEFIKAVTQPHTITPKQSKKTKLRRSAPNAEARP
jgi:hypothetical protein